MFSLASPAINYDEQYITFLPIDGWHVINFDENGSLTAHHR